MKNAPSDRLTYNRRVLLRNRLLKKAAQLNPNSGYLLLRGAARKTFLDTLEDEHLRPRLWRWQFDHVLGTQDRPAFKLYIAAVKLRAIQLRAKKQYDTARILDAHISSLHDVAPREAWCYFPGEWREISKALRPFNCKPPAGTNAARLYVIYQKIRSQRTVEEAAERVTHV